MSRKYVGRPRKAEPWSPRAKELNMLCQKTKYEAGRPFLCYAPTLNGKQYCGTCATKTLTGGDRKPPEQAAPKAYAWANDKRKRA